jgi:hypothetical protein
MLAAAAVVFASLFSSDISRLFSIVQEFSIVFFFPCSYLKDNKDNNTEKDE